MSLWMRWWILFPMANLVGLVLLFVIGYADWDPWLQVFSPLALAVLTSRIVPGIMWDGDPKPPLRRHRDTAPTGHR